LQRSIKETFRILYVSSVDISKPNGPGINELEFVRILLKTFGDRVHLIIPKPESALKLDPRIVTFVRPAHGFIGPHTRHFMQQIEILRTMRSVISSEHFDLIVSRIGLLTFGLALYSLTGKIPFVVKTLGDPTLKYLRRKKGVKGLVAKFIHYPHQWMFRYIVRRAIGVDACTSKLVARNRRICGIDEEKIIHIENVTNTERLNIQTLVL
jgi:hypothetical protein